MPPVIFFSRTSLCKEINRTFETFKNHIVRAIPNFSLRTSTADILFTNRPPIGKNTRSHDNWIARFAGAPRRHTIAIRCCLGRHLQPGSVFRRLVGVPYLHSGVRSPVLLVQFPAPYQPDIIALFINTAQKCLCGR